MLRALVENRTQTIPLEERRALDIHVINLDRSKDRLSTFETMNSHLSNQLRRFPAVDGNGMARGPLIDRGILAADLDYSDGALGIALSHLTLWDCAIAQNQPLTVCEDDAIFNRGFEAAAESLMQHLPAEWHLILWGWNFDSVLLFDMLPGVSQCLGNFNQHRMRLGIDTFQAAAVAPRAFRLIRAFGLVGYTVSPLGARLMKRHCLPLRNLDVPCPGLEGVVPNLGIDVMLNDAYPRINAFVSFPPLVVTKNLHSTSTIQKNSPESVE
jgi:glycosyl transferase family 25